MPRTLITKPHVVFSSPPANVVTPSQSQISTYAESLVGPSRRYAVAALCTFVDRFPIQVVPLD